MKRTIYFILFLCIGLAQYSCKKEDLTVPKDRSALPRSMGDFIRNNYDLSLLSAALQQTGLLDSLNQGGPYTFFAPDNKAFQEWGVNSADDFAKMNKDSLRFALKYHITIGRLYLAEMPLQLGVRYPSLAGPDMYVSTANEQGRPQTPNAFKVLRVNGAVVFNDTKRDIPVANGVIHVIRKVQKYNPGTLQDQIAADTSLSLFKLAMQQFEHWELLKGAGPYTIFAPSNQAFLQYGLTADSLRKINAGDFQPVMMGIYVLMGNKKRIFASDWNQINDPYAVYTNDLHVGDFYIRPYYSFNQYWAIEESYVATADKDGQRGIYGPPQVNFVDGPTRGMDYVAANGVLHKIDALMLYPNAFRK
ncbi:fasciclin domain-containing protein [Chitinophaga pendula]|uniref:fasciclin domain-containing protein n=1 Tax=Chitinophaga TaxID=79328 RepID=UPI0018DF4C62|nr:MULTISPECIES: fasciclin domain-containing protein [Chitinophaga]UCJ08216.1 fasciclin domain-containing protein [Chitinophaga pendula]